MALRDRDLVPDKKKRSKEGIYITVIAALVVGFLIRLIIHSFFVIPVTVEEEAMSPTFKKGEVVTADRRFSADDLKAGTFVFIEHPLNQKHSMIRKIVAVANDRISVRRGAVIVNGTIIESTQSAVSHEPNETDATDDSAAIDRQAAFFDQAETTLKTNQFFVIVDQPLPFTALDSRHFGIVPYSKIKAVIEVTKEK